jgi:hypothetical protein
MASSSLGVEDIKGPAVLEDLDLRERAMLIQGALLPRQCLSVEAEALL